MATRQLPYTIVQEAGYKNNKIIPLWMTLLLVVVVVVCLSQVYSYQLITHRPKFACIYVAGNSVGHAEACIKYKWAYKDSGLYI